jgi:hypothetical protein
MTLAVTPGWADAPHLLEQARADACARHYFQLASAWTRTTARAAAATAMTTSHRSRIQRPGTRSDGGRSTVVRSAGTMRPSRCSPAAPTQTAKKCLVSSHPVDTPRGEVEGSVP